MTSKERGHDLVRTATPPPSPTYNGPGTAVEFAVRYRSGGRIKLRQQRSIFYGMKRIGMRTLPAWIGGEGKWMVLMFTGPEKNDRGRIVPVKALE